MSDLENLKIQFYAVSAVLAFFVIVLIAIVINLSIQVKYLGKIKKNEDEEDVISTIRSPPLPSNSGLPLEYSLSKPQTLKNWQDNGSEIGGQNFQKESLPRVMLSKSWQAFPNDKERIHQNRNPRNDDISTNVQDEWNLAGSYQSPNRNFKNPYSGNSSNNKLNRRPDEISGTNNYAFRRDNNSYY